MEQQIPARDELRGIGLMRSKDQGQISANSDSPVQSIAKKLQTDEQALREWSAKVAEIRRKDQPDAQ